MEESTAWVSILGIVCATILLITLSVFGHEDNNAQKRLTEVCIQVGGEPQFEDEQFIGCTRG